MPRRRLPLSDPDPFSREKLREIFRLDPDDSDRLITRESGTLEFKKNFGFASLSQYARTIAAFANAAGGYIVFGVGNNPRTLDGMTNDRFEQLDPEKLTDYLNERFSPEIRWSAHLYKIGKKSFGIIHVESSEEKPVIAKADADPIKDGEIYYRYRGRTETIKYPELRRIIDGQRRKEQELWLRHIRSIAQIGVSQAGVFDPTVGTVSAAQGTFVIDRAVLPRLKFIREGDFREKEGAPTLRLVGDAQILAAGSIEPVKVEQHPAVVRTHHIISAFLEQQQINGALEYVKAVAYEPSVFLPVYYFIRLAGATVDSVVELLRSTCTDAAEHGKLIERLTTGDPKLAHQIASTSTPASKRKRDLRSEIVSGSVPDKLAESDVRYLMQAIRSLGPNEATPAYLLDLLRRGYEAGWEKSGPLRTEIRLALCFVDHMLFAPR